MDIRGLFIFKVGLVNEWSKILQLTHMNDNYLYINRWHEGSNQKYPNRNRSPNQK